MAKLSRNKGAAGERELATLLSDELGERIRRKLGQARDSGNDLDLWHYRIESKRRRGFVAYGWMEQAQADLEAGQVPVVMVRADGEKEWLVVMCISDWVRLARESGPSLKE